MKTSIKRLINIIEKECSINNVELAFEESNGVRFKNSNIICNGYFIDQPKPVLVVATKKKKRDWILVLLHEYCHMKQWLEKSPAWFNNKLPDNTECSDRLDLWLSGVLNLSDDELERYIQINIELEADCEKRALRLIDEFRLPISKEDYAKKANSYILFYHIVKKYRRWYSLGKEPYFIESVWSKMPETMDLDYTKISPEIEQILLKCFQ